MKFKTESLVAFQTMLQHAIVNGLEFAAYDNDIGIYIIEYTGGY